VLDTLQYLGMTLTWDCSKHSNAIDQIAYINWVLEHFEISSCWKQCALMRDEYPLYAIQAEPGQQSLYARSHQMALDLILYTTLGTRPDITCSMSIWGKHGTPGLTLNFEARKLELRYLEGISKYKLKIYKCSLGYDYQWILCYTDADLGGEADMSKSTSEIVVWALRPLIIWKSRQQDIVGQSIMQRVMFTTAFGEVQNHWLRDFISVIRICRGLTKHILNDGLNCITTLNWGNFQSARQHLHL
jgi:hypothetical protein